MKKIPAVILSIMLFSVPCFSKEKEINIRAGIDPVSSLMLENKRDSQYENVDMGITVSAEYLMKAYFDFLRAGAGTEFVTPRVVKYSDKQWKFFYLPVYFTVKANPIPMNEEVFFKANVGMNVYFDINDNAVKDKKGGLYWSISLGYEYVTGFIIDISYGSYSFLSYRLDFNYSKLGVNLGYKFNL